MTPAHRAQRRLTRRHVVGGLAALAAVPAVILAARQIGADETAAEATTSPGRGAVPGSAPPSAGAGPAVVTKGGGPVPFRPGRAMLGAYLGLEGRSLTWPAFGGLAHGGWTGRCPGPHHPPVCRLPTL